MKKSILLLSAISILLFSCGNDSGKTPTPTKDSVKSHRDSTIVLATWLTYGLKGYDQGLARQITIHDTSVWVKKDSATFVLERGDSVYFQVPISFPIKDSNTAKAYGVKWRNGLDTLVTILAFAPPQYVRTGVTRIDSAHKYLSQFRDTTAKK